MFKALASETRRKMLKILAENEMHISGLARELRISVPVAAKHVKILEKYGLIERKNFGRSHILRAKTEKLYGALDIFGESFNLKVSKGANVLDALKEISGITVEKVGDKEYVTSVDGEAGYYIYEVNGKSPNKSINKFKLEKNSKIELKKLVPVKKKEISIKIT